MWPMIAEAGLRCQECRHDIQAGRLCLSELPEEKPPGTARTDFKNYCIGCPRCWAQGKHACYARHLEDRFAPTGNTPRSLPCARCGRRMSAGDKARVDLYFEWANVLEERAGSKGTNLPGLAGTAATAAGAVLWLRGVPTGSFESLSQGLQRKFATAGLRGDYRSTAEAQSFYQQSIPHPVRNLGQDSVESFLDGKDASHIQSVQNAPHLASENANLMWEDSIINRARGAENMTGSDQFWGQAGNTFDATDLLFRECLETAGMTALWAGLMEAPVATIENYFHYKRVRKTGEEAVQDAAKAIALRAGTGAAIGFAVSGAVAVVGGASVLVTVAPYLIPVGLALYGHNALKRIQRARAYDSPPGMEKVGTYFCSSHCHTRFAYETGLSALTRWEQNRATAKS